MVFSTILFLCVFLPLVIIGYYLVPSKGKNLFLLLVSLFFYAWGEPAFVFVMFASIMLNYVFGMGIYQFASKRKLFLGLAILSNLSILGVFKYADFAVETVNRFLPGQLPLPQLVLPIGISFYTFQGMSYVIDVYRKEATKDKAGNKVSIVQKNPINLALYISMFPQLIAGPIVRYEDICASLVKRKHSMELFAAGIERFIIGLAKKTILANEMGEISRQIMEGNFSYMSASAAWLGAIAYTLQIYFDFSGYSDMAIGLGKIFGFQFMENFNYPYISRSIREFWRRWHISLSSWFRDYLYIPLGGNRRGNVYLHLMIAFLATGLWHGAAWGFVLWGLWNGVFIVLERFATERNWRVPNVIAQTLGRAYTLLVVILGWVLFSLVSVRDACAYIKVMFGANNGGFHAYDIAYYLGGRELFLLIIAVLACIPWKEAIVRMRAHKAKTEEPGNQGTEENASDGIALAWLIVRRVWMLLLLVLSFICIITCTYNPFIYFRF